jgi:hypothetical protein
MKSRPVSTARSRDGGPHRGLNKDPREKIGELHRRVGRASLEIGYGSVPRVFFLLRTHFFFFSLLDCGGSGPPHQLSTYPEMGREVRRLSAMDATRHEPESEARKAG